MKKGLHFLVGSVHDLDPDLSSSVQSGRSKDIGFVYQGMSLRSVLCILWSLTAILLLRLRCAVTLVVTACAWVYHSAAIKVHADKSSVHLSPFFVPWKHPSCNGGMVFASRSGSGRPFALGCNCTFC